MPHNLLVADYGLGHPGSVHDAYAFQGTQVAQRADQVLPANHWIWADSAYPSQTWCVVPFKAARSVALSRGQKVYNQHLSKVRTFWKTIAYNLSLESWSGSCSCGACICCAQRPVSIASWTPFADEFFERHSDCHSLDPMLPYPAQHDNSVWR